MSNARVLYDHDHVVYHFFIFGCCITEEQHCSRLSKSMSLASSFLKCFVLSIPFDLLNLIAKINF